MAEKHLSLGPRCPENELQHSQAEFARWRDTPEAKKARDAFFTKAALEGRLSLEDAE